MQEEEEAAMAAATAQAAALTAEMTGIMPPTPVQAIRIRCRETSTRRGLKDAVALSITTKDEGEGGNSAAVFALPLWSTAGLDRLVRSRPGSWACCPS